MSHDVFISYSAHDKVIADATCAALEAQKIRCWIAPRDVLAGTEYGEAIVKGIGNCRVLVLIFSGQANESTYVRKEVERAVSKGKIIIPFRIENILPSDAMEIFLSNTHWLDALTPPIEAHITALVASVHRLLGRDHVDGPQHQMLVRVVGFLNDADGGFRLERLIGNDIGFDHAAGSNITVHRACCDIIALLAVKGRPKSTAPQIDGDLVSVWSMNAQDLGRDLTIDKLALNTVVIAILNERRYPAELLKRILANTNNLLS